MGISKMTEILQTTENSNASNKMLAEIKKSFKSPLKKGFWMVLSVTTEGAETRSISLKERFAGAHFLLQHCKLRLCLKTSGEVRFMGKEKPI